jgi:hypothetical protein
MGWHPISPRVKDILDEVGPQLNIIIFKNERARLMRGQGIHLINRMVG